MSRPCRPGRDSRRGDERAEVAGGGQRDGGRVVGERPEQVALDGAQSGTGQPDRIRYREQVAADQGEVGRLDGGVGAGVHGQAQVGLGEPTTSTSFPRT